MAKKLSRRAFLTRSAVIGCSAAASPLLTPVSFAAAPWDARLVVIILRGAMDGLDVVQPYGDRSFASLRPNLGFDRDRATDLDGFFALHPGLDSLVPLWCAGELGFAHAVSTPYRDKRSHFDGQDLLEAGTGALTGQRDGWLNRMLQHVPGIEAETAYAIGRDEMRLLSGMAPVAEWAPDAGLALSAQALRLMERITHDDPLFRDAIGEAIDLSGAEAMAMSMEVGDEEMMASMAESTKSASQGDAHRKVAEFAAEKLRGASRIAAFSLNGWDTHADQSRYLPLALTRLQDTILDLKAGLGPVWGQTTVLAMTEFGRTAHENGSKGTDHGTAGAVLMAGGAIKGGKVYGKWPGLADADLYQSRDLTPTQDVRAIAGWAMHDLFGLDRNILENAVFPGLSLETNPGIIL